jgi:hypothetical protein
VLGVQEAQMVLAVAQSVRAGAAMLPEVSRVRTELTALAGRLTDEATQHLERVEPPADVRQIDLRAKP